MINLVIIYVRIVVKHASLAGVFHKESSVFGLPLAMFGGPFQQCSGDSVVLGFNPQLPPVCKASTQIDDLASF